MAALTQPVTPCGFSVAYSIDDVVVFVSTPSDIFFRILNDGLSAPRNFALHPHSSTAQREVKPRGHAATNVVLKFM